MGSEYRLSRLNDSELVSGLSDLVRRGNELTAEVLAHLAELELRLVHLELGFSSVFAYCVQALGLSEAAAGRRLTGARVCRQFPEVFALVASGDLHLSALCALARHLTVENARELFSASRRKTRRQIEALLAARFPRPDVREQIRRLPARGEPSPRVEGPPSRMETRSARVEASLSVEPLRIERSQPFESLLPEVPRFADVPASLGSGEFHVQNPGEICAARNAERMSEGQFQPGTVRRLGAERDGGMSPESLESATHSEFGAAPEAAVGSAGKERPFRRQGAAPRAREIEALSATRFGIHFTADLELRELIERARALASHRVPNGELAAVLKLALSLFVKHEEKRRFAVGTTSVRRRLGSGKSVRGSEELEARVTVGNATLAQVPARAGGSGLPARKDSSAPGGGEWWSTPPGGVFAQEGTCDARESTAQVSMREDAHAGEFAPPGGVPTRPGARGGGEPLAAAGRVSRRKSAHAAETHLAPPGGVFAQEAQTVGEWSALTGPLSKPEGARSAEMSLAPSGGVFAQNAQTGGEPSALTAPPSKHERARAAERHLAPPGGVSERRGARGAEASPASSGEVLSQGEARAARKRSRHVPAAVRREVYERDRGRCAFVSSDGRRCEARNFLEYDHLVPWAASGGAAVDNIRLLCRAHNALHAGHCFGRESIADKVAVRRRERILGAEARRRRL